MLKTLYLVTSWDMYCNIFILIDPSIMTIILLRFIAKCLFLFFVMLQNGNSFHKHFTNTCWTRMESKRDPFNNDI